jgi:hypothetical protein
MGMAELVEAGGGLRGSFQGAVARDYGISRRGVITLVQRYLADGTDVEILNIVDDHSRLCIASVCRPDQRRSPQQSTSTRPLPSMPRHHRRLRQAHPAPRQPTPPHRHRPMSPPSTSPGPRQRPPRPQHHHQRRTTPRLSNSIPAGTTNPNPKWERCPKTPVHGVPRQCSGVTEGT